MKAGNIFDYNFVDLRVFLLPSSSVPPTMSSIICRSYSNKDAQYRSVAEIYGKRRQQPLQAAIVYSFIYTLLTNKNVFEGIIMIIYSIQYLFVFWTMMQLISQNLKSVYSKITILPWTNVLPRCRTNIDFYQKIYQNLKT